jgi:16S rRNA (adenine1518-N6/adenine1519-N6)-dimethyltransferase
LSEAHRARKRFGQHFLVDRTWIQRIVDAIDPQPDDRVVEIGPGLGALTDVLIERLARLDAVEIDRDLAGRLSARYPHERLHVHVGDALDFDFQTLGPGLRVVGNLPYNISSPLMFKLIESTASIRDVHVMLQKEVVDRMVAAPGSRDYGRLSVMLGYYFRVERLFRINAGAFRPQPKVDSAFARLVPRRTHAVAACDQGSFARIVAAAFGQRRKTLRNALAQFADENVLLGAGVDPRLRAEMLSVEQFVTLANKIAASGAG